MHTVASPTTARPLRVLIVVNDEIRERDVRSMIAPDLVDRAVETLVVAPALNSFLGRQIGDAAIAERDAERRTVQAVLTLSAAGIPSSGIVGDADPLLAIEDALSVYDADEVVIAVGTRNRGGWLGEKLAQRAQARLGVPVRHAVVDT